MYGTKDTCIKGCVKKLINEGGLKGMWRGNGINVLKIAPESALKFMAYEQAKKFIRAHNGDKDLTIIQRFFAGSTAGVFSQTLIYPLEVSYHTIMSLESFLMMYHIKLGHIQKLCLCISLQCLIRDTHNKTNDFNASMFVLITSNSSKNKFHGVVFHIE